MKVLAFDGETGVLRVELPGFPNYEVFNVPVETFESMQSADSPIGYFNEHIWGMKFEHDSHWPSLEALLGYMGEHMFFDPPVTVQTVLGDGDTPLHVASIWGDISAIELLIMGGAEVNARGDMGTTPIYNAVEYEWVRCVALLLSAGATIGDPNGLGFTARQVVHMNKNPILLDMIS